VTIETVGAPFARGGDNYAGSHYTSSERTATELDPSFFPQIQFANT
jgi:hypothetical protein